MAIYSKTIEGLDELITDFNRLGDAAIPHLDNAINYASKVLYRSALSKINNRTGELAKAVFVKPARVSKSTKMIINGSVGVNKTAQCDYGVYVELGHVVSRSKRTKEDHKLGTNAMGFTWARPFLRPAADENKETVATILTKAMERALREVME